MATIGNNDAARALGEKLKPKFKFIEIVLVVAVITGIALKVEYIDAYLPVFVMSCSALAVLYYLMGVMPAINSSKIEALITKIVFWGCAVAVTGLLFTVQNYPGTAMMLNLGTISLAGSTLYFLVKIQTDFVKANRNMVIRSIVLLLVCIGLVSTPKEQLYALHLIHKIKQYNFTHQDPSLYTPKVIVIDSIYKRLTKTSVSAEIDSLKKEQLDNKKMGLLQAPNPGDSKKRLSFLQDAYNRIDTGANVYIWNNVISENITIIQFNLFMDDETFNGTIQLLNDYINKSNIKGDSMRLINSGVKKYKNKYTFRYTETYFGKYRRLNYSYWLNINDVTFMIVINTQKENIDFEKIIGIF